jgi:hypothetical protein
MIKAIKNITKRTFLYDVVQCIRNSQRLRDWEKNGRPVTPSPIYKQRVVKEYAREFSICTFIETGTLFGDMVYATRGTFDRIFSIELDRHLYERARERFSRFAHIHIVPGDSVQALPIILANVSEACLFWLDAHAMVNGVRGELITPIRQELHHILNHPVTDHVILIDDARLFVGRSDYPTLEEVKALILGRYPDWVFEVEDDIIRAHERR